MNIWSLFKSKCCINQTFCVILLLFNLHILIRELQLQTDRDTKTDEVHPVKIFVFHHRLFCFQFQICLQDSPFFLMFCFMLCFYHFIFISQRTSDNWMHLSHRIHINSECNESNKNKVMFSQHLMLVFSVGLYVYRFRLSPTVIRNLRESWKLSMRRRSVSVYIYFFTFEFAISIDGVCIQAAKHGWFLSLYYYNVNGRHAGTSCRNSTSDLKELVTFISFLVNVTSSPTVNIFCVLKHLEQMFMFSV